MKNPRKPLGPLTDPNTANLAALDVCGPAVRAAGMLSNLDSMDQVRKCMSSQAAQHQALTSSSFMEQAVRAAAGMNAADAIAQTTLKGLDWQQDAIDRFHGSGASNFMEQAKDWAQSWAQKSSTIDEQVKNWLNGPAYQPHAFQLDDAMSAAQDVANEMLRRERQYVDAFSGFTKVQDVLAQLDLTSSLATKAMAASQTSAFLDIKRAMGPAIDLSSLADTVVGRLGALGLSAYRDPIQDILKNIDFDAIQGIASRAGEALEKGIEIEDEEPSLDDVRDAIGQAELDTVREVVDEAVADALRRVLEEKAGDGANKLPAWAMVVFVSILWPLLIGVFTTVAQPLYARYLAQQDAAEAAAKAQGQAEAKAQAQPQFRFQGIVVVKTDNAQLRVGPSTTERTLTLLPRGQVIEIQKKKGLWVRVRYVDALHDGVSYTGWMKVKQTQSIQEEAARMIWCALTEGASTVEACKVD